MEEINAKERKEKEGDDEMEVTWSMENKTVPDGTNKNENESDVSLSEDEEENDKETGDNDKTGFDDPFFSGATEMKEVSEDEDGDGEDVEADQQKKKKKPKKKKKSELTEEEKKQKVRSLLWAWNPKISSNFDKLLFSDGLWVRGLMVANVGFKFRDAKLDSHRLPDHDGPKQVVYIVP